jgi:hypothetical protein
VAESDLIEVATRAPVTLSMVPFINHPARADAKGNPGFVETSDGVGVIAQANDFLFLEVDYYSYVYLFGSRARVALADLRTFTRERQRRWFVRLRRR